jgi:RND family efflux transporter MFP subunit
MLAFLLLGGVMAYFAGFFEKKISLDTDKTPISADSDQTFKVQLVKEPLIEQAAGTLRAKIETIISPLISSTIISISVRSGDLVKQGDHLVTLDARELNARVEQAYQSVLAAKARLQKAEKDFQRVQRIYKLNPAAIAKAEVDRYHAAQETAIAELERYKRLEDETRTTLSYGTLTAPISGRIVERYAEPGDIATPGEPLLKIYDPGTLRLEAHVRESIASKLTKGQALFAEVDAVEKQFDVVVDEIVPSADPGSRSFIVKATLKGDNNLFPGMFGRLLIPVGQIERIYIPADAVITIGQLDMVMVKTATGSSRRFIRPGKAGSGNLIEVISGVSPGEIIIQP